MKININYNKEEFFLDQINRGYYIPHEDGRIWSNKKNKFIGQTSKTGYRVMCLVHPETKKPMSMKIHRLIYRYFKGDLPIDQPYINHIDGNPLNNHIDNLEPCTLEENIKHALKLGLMNNVKNFKITKGTDSPNAKFTYEEVLEIRTKFANSEMTLKELSKKYDIHTRNLTNLLHGHSYKNVPLVDCTKVNNKPANKENEEYLLNLFKENKYIVYEDGKIWSNYSNKFVGGIREDGYVILSFRKEGKYVNILGHRFVYLYFKGHPPKDAPFINHIDGNKSNNAISNLEAVSHFDNVTHAFSLGLAGNITEEHKLKVSIANSGSNQNQAAIPKEIINELREKYNSGNYFMTDLSKEYGISYNALKNFFKGRTYKND